MMPEEYAINTLQLHPQSHRWPRCLAAVQKILKNSVAEIVIR